MDIVKRIAAVYLVLAAAAVAAHFVFEPFYADAVDTGQVWNTLDWFMAAGVLITLIVCVARKIQLDRIGRDQSTTRDYLTVQVALYSSIVLTLWFFWNWFDNLLVDEASDVRSIYWALIDPLFVLVVGRTGLHLWGRSAASQ